MAKIYILSAPIQTGKTTALTQWISNKSNITGFLTPDKDGKRKFLSLDTLEYFDFQKELKTEEHDIEIGRFVFDGNIFTQAQIILKQAVTSQASWIVVDEVGKLELEDKGYEPALTLMLEALKQMPDKKILLVVRDTLLTKAIEKYEWNDAIVLSLEQFKKEMI